MRGLISSTALGKLIPILSLIHLDIMINVHWSSFKLHVIFVTF